MKQYLLQTRFNDGTVTATMARSNAIINMYGFQDCLDEEFEVFDVSEFGKVVRLEHISYPGNHHVFISTETGEVMFEGNSIEH